MADNVPITAGTGTDVATDDVGGVHHQKVKIEFGVADSATMVSSSDPLPVVQTGALPAGTNAIGKLAANSGVDIGDVDVTTLIPGTGATNLGKAEDAAHTTGDVGVMVLGVRKDSIGTLVDTDADYTPLAVDGNGSLRVGGIGALGLLKQEDAAHASADAGVMALAVQQTADAALAGTTGDYAPLQVDDTGFLKTTLKTALPAGTNNIGDVDVLTLPALPAGTNAIGKLAANSGVDIGDVDVTSVNGFAAHDAGVAGVPLMVAGVVQDTDDTAPPNQVSAESDVARLACTYSGALMTVPHPPRIWQTQNEYTTQQTNASVKAAPGAGLVFYITDIYLHCNAAATVSLLDGSGGTVLYRFYAAGPGDGVTTQRRSPIKLTANTALCITTSAAVTLFLAVGGYTAP